MAIQWCQRTLPSLKEMPIIMLYNHAIRCYKNHAKINANIMQKMGKKRHKSQEMDIK